MSKKTQFLEDFTMANLCAYSIGIYSINLILRNGGFKTLDFKIGPMNLKIPSGSLFIKTGKQPKFIAKDKSGKFKNAHNTIQFLPFNTGLVFVLTAFYELNTSINCYRP